MIWAMLKFAVFKYPAPRTSVIDVNYVVVVFCFVSVVADLKIKSGGCITD
jgi:hypothetical protein